MSDKKYSPKEAAIAVLNRAAELYKKSTLSKSEDLKKGEVPPPPAAPPTPMAQAQASMRSAFGSGPAVSKSDEAPMKGHIKLAKFVGAMEQKRGKHKLDIDKGETGHEKGVHTSIIGPPEKHRGEPENSAGKTTNMLGGTRSMDQGQSKAGRSTMLGGSGNKVDAKMTHQKVLSEMQSMSKPKLPG